MGVLKARSAEAVSPALPVNQAALVSNRAGWSTEQQRQERSTALVMPDSQEIARRTELNNAVNMEQNLGSSTKILSRREEAMALLEGRHHSLAPG